MSSARAITTTGRNISSVLKRVYVYEGQGSPASCVQNMVTSLSRCLAHRVTTIDAETVVTGDWTKNAAAIVFGGGNTSGFVSALGSAGAQRIKDYVHGGGTYLGVGAGAYLGCDTVLFIHGAYRVDFVTRPLVFFPGTCLGPINRTFDPRVTASDAWQPVTFHLHNGDVTDDVVIVDLGDDAAKRSDVITAMTYVHGGGKFLQHLPPQPDCPEVTVLARYQAEPKKPPAVVMCRVGEGQAILCSPQLEMDLPGEKQTQTQKLKDHGEIDTGDKGSNSPAALRDFCWRWLLRQGGLETAVVSPSTPSSTTPSPFTHSPFYLRHFCSGPVLRNVAAGKVEFG